MPLPGFSNQIANVRIQVDDIVGHAMRRCRRTTPELPQEIGAATQQLLYIFLSSLANRGVQLWCIEKDVYGLVQSQPTITTLAGTVDSLEPLYRTITLVGGGTGSSSQVAQSTDDLYGTDIDTATIQTAPDGNFGYDFGQSVVISSVGWMPFGALNLNPVVDGSPDGVVWTAVYAIPPDYNSTTVNGSDRQWVWRDIPVPRSFRYWRFRETEGATLSLRCLQFARAPNEIPMYRMNLDDYSSLSNKTFESRQPLQFWFDRQVNYPLLRLWPTPSYNFDQVVVWRHRHILDPGTLTNVLEIPQRWYDAIIAGFAIRLLEELPPDPQEANKDYEVIMARLERRYAMALADAESEERDHSPFTITPDVSVYTR